MAETAFKTRLAQVLAWVAVVCVALFAAPYIIGYGIALGGYVPYGVVCNKRDELFSGKIDRDDYSTFLMNRGCNYEEEIKRLLLDDTYFKNIDPRSVMDHIRNQGSAAGSTEVMAAEYAKAAARTFKAPPSGDRDGCRASNQDYCAAHPWFNDDTISSIFRSVGDAYLGFFSAANVGFHF